MAARALALRRQRTLQPVPGIDLDDYKHTLIERFSNEHVRDTLARMCAESSDRIPKWLLPVIRINPENGGEIRRTAAIVAAGPATTKGLTSRETRSMSWTG